MKTLFVSLFSVLFAMLNYHWQTVHIVRLVTARDLSNTSWTYNYEGGFSYGVIQLQYVEDTTIENSVFSKFDRCYTSVVSGNDTLRGKDAPLFLREEESVLYVSYNGVTADTLYYFAGVPDDYWVYSFTNLNGEELSLQVTVLDTFTRQFDEQILSSQIVEFDYLNGLRPFTDTVVAHVGAIQVYFDPFEFLVPTVEGEKGGVLRCFQNGSWAIPFNQGEPQIYTVDCQLILTSLMESNTEHDPLLQIIGNPVRDELLVFSGSITPVKASVLASSGQQVASLLLVNGNNLIDCSAWPPGVYLIVAASGEVLRFVK